MRTIIICTLLIVICSCKNNEPVQEKIKFTPVSDSINMTVDIPNAWELFPVYLDSIKKFKTGMPLPAYFYNYQLDYEYPWLADHGSWSLRKMLFDSTQNLALLNAVIASGDLRLKKVAIPDSLHDKDLLEAIPYHKISNYDLAKQRLQQLNKQQ